jgi:hypothetical protein
MRLPAVEVASYDVELKDDEPRYVPRSLDADAFRTSDWHRPNCRAIREGVTPALKLPEWHLADGVNDGGAPTCPRRDDGRTVGNGGARVWAAKLRPRPDFRLLPIYQLRE